MEFAESTREGSRVSLRQLQAGLNWILRFARAKPLGAIGGVLIVITVFIAVMAPALAAYDPVVMDYSNLFRPPSQKYLFGTDNFGRDVLSRILFGARISLYVGLLSIGVSSAIGGIAGITTTWIGGKTDLFIQRLVDVLMGFPPLVLALALMAAMGSSLNNVVVALALVWTPRCIRVVGAAAMSVKETQYVEAAQIIGASQSRIIFRHILPNCLAPLFVLATGAIGNAMVTEATLSFLGLGVPPPNPSWGSMLAGAATQYSRTAPWLVVFPGVALTFVVYGFNLLGDALRDVLDPRLKR